MGTILSLHPVMCSTLRKEAPRLFRCKYYGCCSFSFGRFSNFIRQHLVDFVLLKLSRSQTCLITCREDELKLLCRSSIRCFAKSVWQKGPFYIHKDSISTNFSCICLCQFDFFSKFFCTTFGCVALDGDEAF